MGYAHFGIRHIILLQGSITQSHTLYPIVMDFSLPLLPTDTSDSEELYPSLPLLTVTQPMTPTVPLTPTDTDLHYVTVTEDTSSSFLPPLIIPRRELSFQGETDLQRQHRISYGIDQLKAQCFRGNGSGERFRNWCYTIILNDTEFHKAYEPIIEEDMMTTTIPLIKKLQSEVFFDIRTPITYHVWEIEHGSTTGTKHIQGYVEFDKKMIMNTVKKIFAAHGCISKHEEEQLNKLQTTARKKASTKSTELSRNKDTMMLVDSTPRSTPWISRRRIRTSGRRSRTRSRKSKMGSYPLRYNGSTIR